MSPTPDSPIILALRSVDADLVRVDAQIAPLAAELAKRKKERQQLTNHKEELLDCLLGKRSFQPALVPEPAAETSPPVMESPVPVMETGQLVISDTPLSPGHTYQTPAKAEYVMGSGDEKRRLIAPPAKPKKRKAG